jgi:hypothetical protein
MIAELILLLSAFCFCFSKRGEKKKRKEKGKKKKSFLVDQPTATCFQHPGFWDCYMCYKKLI